MFKRNKSVDAQENAPPWRAGNERDRQQMFIWVNAELDAISKNNRTGDIKPIPPEYAERYRAWRNDAGLEKLAARHGYIELLRRRYPELAEFLHPPKLKPGEKFPNNRIEAVDHAVEDLSRIRQIWKKQYGRCNRRPDDGPNAVQISAKRWNVTEHSVLGRQKRRRG